MRPDLRNRTDSYAPLYVSLQIGGVNVPLQDSFRGLELNNLGFGAWHGTITLFDETFNDIEALLLQSAPDYQVKFSFGWDEKDRIGRLPVYTGMIVSYLPIFHEAGTTLELDVCATSVATSVLNRIPKSDKPLSWPQGWGKSPTTMFQDIATAQGWKEKLILEDSLQVAAAFNIPDNFSAIRFIREKLLPEAANSKGQTFRYYIDSQNQIHFHSMQFLTGSGALAEDYVFNTMFEGRAEVISFAPQDAKILSVLLGGGTANHVSIDSLEGTPLIYKSTQDKGTPDAKRPQLTADTQDVRKVTDPSIQTQGSYAGRNEGQANDARMDLKRRANSVWTQLESVSYVAGIDVRGTNAIDIMDLIRVKYYMKDVTSGGKSLKQHYMSGVFQIQKIKHSVGNGHWVTQMEGIRDGSLSHPTDTELPAPTPNAIFPPNFGSVALPVQIGIPKTIQRAAK